MMKRYLHNSLRALLLSLAVLLSLPMMAVEIDGINYELIAKVKQATVIEKSSGKYSGEIVIPESVEYGGTAYSVTSIGYMAFYYCSGLTSVTIPNSVTSIGDYAFNYCSSLTSVTIPNSVTSIGNWAFSGCSGLTSVTIPNSVTSIGSGAFRNCSRLTSVTIPNSVTSIGGYAFSGCSGLTSVTIPNSVTSIGGSAFRDCSGLTSVTIGNSVTSIGKYAFYNCDGLTSVTIGNSVTDIGNSAFYGCSELLDVYCLAEKVPSAKEDAFYGSNPEYATLHVPDASVDSYKATSPWSSFGKIVALTDEELAVKVMINGINYELVANVKQATVIAKSSGKYSGEIVIPESVEYGGTAYSVTSIGEKAFYECSGLTSVTIPNSVTSIGDYAFDGCSKLQNVYCLAEKVPSASYAFDKPNLQYATLHVPAASIDSYKATSPWSSFGKIVALSGEELAVKVMIDGINYELVANVKQATVIKKSSGEYFGEIVIPESVEYGGTAYSVTSIGNSAFYYCSALTSVTIPNSVTSIGDKAFQLCIRLTSVTIGNSVTSIGVSAFSACSGLTSVTIPNSVTSIENYAFNGCSGLTSVTIPNSVTSIGYSAFRDCSGLTSVHISDIAAWCNIYFGNSFSNPLYYAQHLYMNGEKIKDLVIPNSVTSIGYCTFYNCTGLTSVTIPNSVTSIGNWAFRDCSKLKNVYCLAEKVPSAGSDAFYNSNPEYATLHVPAASIDSYKATSPWSSFGKIIALTDEELAVKVMINGINYELVAKAKQATVIEKSSGKYSGEIVIPESVEHGVTTYSVTSIRQYAFEGCSRLTSVTIPNSVTSIGDYAFEGCSGLTSVTIGNSVTSIGWYAFYNCYRLTSVTIGNSVESIGKYAFYKCSGLTSVHISDIAAWCNIEFVVDSSNPLFYAHHLYMNGEEIKDLVIPNSVTSIGKYAFSDCSALTSVTIGNSVTSIGKYAFSDCSALTSVTIGNSVTSIGNSAFWDCSELFDVYCLAEKVPSADSYAFYESYIKYATLHVPAASIDSYKATSPWSSFLKIVALTDEELAVKVMIDGINYRLSEYVKQATVIAKSSGMYSGEIVIPESVEYGGTAYSVTSIGEKAFYDCSGLTSVTIPNGVTSIGKYAFEGCSGLTSVTIPNSVTSIGYSAFWDCSKLLDVYCLAEKVPSAYSYAFYKSYIKYATLHVPAASIDSYKATSPWSSFGKIVALTDEELAVKVMIDGINYRLSEYVKQATVIAKSSGMYSGEIVIPESVEYGGTAYSVTSIGDYAFQYCSGLTSVTIGNSVTSIGYSAFRDCSGLTSVTIPNSVTSIGYSAFRDCSGLTSVTIPNSVTSIGDYAFYGCSGLTSVTIPNSVTSIGKYAFAGCSGLTSVTIGNSVTSIGKYAFAGCTGLTSVTIPNSVTSIGGYAFRDCSGLTSVTIPNSVTSIGDYAFIYCSGLTSVTIGNSVTSIGNYTFYECSGLTSVTIPNSVTSIREGAFSGCSGLTSVTIGNSVTSIGDEAFARCPEILDVYCLAEKVPSADSYAFYKSYPEYATLHVPDASVDSYKAEYPWSSFGKIVALTGEDENEETGVISVEAAPVLVQGNGGVLSVSGVARDTEVVVYTISGTEVARATATDGTATISTGLQRGTIVVVKFGNKSVKVRI